MEEEAEELARATAAVARLVAPETSGTGSGSTDGSGKSRTAGGSKVTAAQKVKMLEEKLVEAREDVNHGSMDAEDYMPKH